MRNEMTLEFLSISANESLARVSVASFISQLNPTMEELTDIKTVVSEAVTNAIIHGYEEKNDEKIVLTCAIDGEEIELIIKDHGNGIENIDLAKEPLYTSKPEWERSGMGFTIMENFMDQVDITSEPGVGTTIRMTKQLTSTRALCN
ncbi:anti-sigma F factor [Halobacillus litoralis]|uniref:Anti-sigma F factor n=1 Tax=Halobacillus litoralis TaxID=45668 RepID=A0A845DSH1_9BACI|nr:MULTISPECIES: anti-sigma F factor [Halobacillus]MCA1022733.1 anti-sigma F factor [Halobacillus litoralis]MYL19485.1 anti-sigma F factor [Halobacillus litoralis]MYL28631.1 anti-sigma F factor [Halobacillus halophilus]MYL37938.1 anti-sigma F factor [Halobacillus litoralis]